MGGLYHEARQWPDRQPSDPRVPGIRSEELNLQVPFDPASTFRPSTRLRHDSPSADSSSTGLTLSIPARTGSDPRRSRLRRLAALSSRGPGGLLDGPTDSPRDRKTPPQGAAWVATAGTGLTCQGLRAANRFSDVKSERENRMYAAAARNAAPSLPTLQNPGPGPPARPPVAPPRFAESVRVRFPEDHAVLRYPP